MRPGRCHLGRAVCYPQRFIVLVTVALVSVAMSLAVAMAAATATVVTFPMAVTMAATGGTLRRLELTGKEGRHSRIAVARGAGIDVDPSLAERVDGAPTDAAAHEHIDTALREHAGKRTVTRPV